MLWIYFDASGLIKRYSSEIGTSLVNEVFVRVPINRITCSIIGILEIVSILVRKRNDGRLNPPQFNQMMIEFKAEVIDRADFLATSIDDRTVLTSLDLIAKHNLNATDTIILRSVLNLQQALQSGGDSILLWTSDKRLARAAQNEGVNVFDPEIETIVHLHQLLGIPETTSETPE